MMLQHYKFKDNEWNLPDYLQILNQSIEERCTYRVRKLNFIWTAKIEDDWSPLPDFLLQFTIGTDANN